MIKILNRYEIDDSKKKFIDVIIKLNFINIFSFNTYKMFLHNFSHKPFSARWIIYILIVLCMYQFNVV